MKLCLAGPPVVVNSLRSRSEEAPEAFAGSKLTIKGKEKVDLTPGPPQDLEIMYQGLEGPSTSVGGSRVLDPNNEGSPDKNMEVLVVSEVGCSNAFEALTDKPLE